MDGRNSLKNKKIEKKNRRTGCGPLIAMHVGCMVVCICMAGFLVWYVRWICICTWNCGFAYVREIVDLWVDLLLGGCAGASLPSLILGWFWTSLASTCICRMCVRDHTLNRLASLLRRHPMRRLHATTKALLFFLLHCRHLSLIRIAPWLRLGDYDSQRLDQGEPRTRRWM
jgi:hypothetical protein